MDKCQSILCSVKSCIYNEKNENHCTLDAIQVSAAAKSDSGAPYDETLCASYKKSYQNEVTHMSALEQKGGLPGHAGVIPVHIRCCRDPC
jgi:hypothetical protein